MPPYSFIRWLLAFSLRWYYVFAIFSNFILLIAPCWFFSPLPELTLLLLFFGFRFISFSYSPPLFDYHAAASIAFDYFIISLIFAGYYFIAISWLFAFHYKTFFAISFFLSSTFLLLRLFRFHILSFLLTPFITLFLFVIISHHYFHFSFIAVSLHSAAFIVMPLLFTYFIDRLLFHYLFHIAVYYFHFFIISMPLIIFIFRRIVYYYY